MKTELALDSSGKPVATQRRQEAKAQRRIISDLAVLSPNIIAFCKDFTGARNLFREWSADLEIRGINSALLWLRLSRVKPLLLCVLALIPPALPAATNDLSGWLQKGLFEEEANRNLDAAAEAYQAVSAQYDRDRALAATAIFRLGEIYRKQSKTNEAVLQYERIVREFPDQETLVRLSRQNLAGIGAGSAATATPPPPSATPELTAEAQAGDTAVADDEEKELRRIQAMIQNSPDLINAGSKPPIFSAVEQGQLKVVKFLLDHGARANVRSAGLPGFGRTPLLVAASTGQKAIAELLLANGADITARDNMGLGALHLAAEKGFLAVAELLIARGAEVNALDNNGDTPLHSAASKGQPEMESLLIRHGAEVNARDNRGRTPLSLAAEGNHLEAVKILLAAKADPNIVDQDGRTPLSYAGVNLELLRVLLAAKADPNLDTTRPPLIQAADGNNSAALALLLAHGANPEVRGGDDNVTPLLIMILHSNTNGIAALLAAGADVNVQDRSGNSALHYAVRAGNPAVLQMLLEKGANPNVRNDRGLTPLDLTKPSRWPEAVTPQSRLVTADIKAKMAELLRAHGALDELPDFTAIRITRGTLSPYVIFKKDRNGWNHFTLFEALLGFYIGIRPPAGIPSSRDMPFPDLTQIRIQRFSPTQPAERKEIVVNLLNATNGIDCAQNLPLEFGDLIDIPEREHRLAEMGVGLTDQQQAELVRCVPKQVRVIFRGEAVEVPLSPDWAYLHVAIQSSPVQSLLRSSADLSRVKVTRKDPAAGQPQEFIVNVNPSSPSLLPPSSPRPVRVALPRDRPVEGFWLQNGDVIEVPEKPE